MTKPPSLALRLAFYLFVANVIGVIATTLAIELFVQDDRLVFLNKNRNELAVPRVYDLMIESLRPTPSGELIIDPSPGLRAEMLRNPRMTIAAFHAGSGAPLSGSSALLANELAGLKKIRTTHLHFRIADDDRDEMTGHLSVGDTPFGPLALASYGHRFQWIDLLLSLRYEITSYLRYFLLAAIFAILVAWVAFKRGLAPLDRVAREAERIDLASLHQRLPLKGIPAEAMPLVDSMNKALTRLDEGAERQRRFLANAAHELRTPVAILLERLDEPPNHSMITKLRQDAERIRNIVEQLLASGRLDRQESRRDETVDLNAAVESIVDDNALLAVKMNKTLAFESDQGMQLVSVDRFALQSVLTNLIHNALRAEPVGGTVIVRVASAKNIEVVDHGAGVAPIDRELIFEPFWRKDESASGTGLGLAIAKELIEKLGGSIVIKDTLGGGATFLVHL
jgi:signal transduction histidine kinase